MADIWSIVEDRFELERNRAYESIFALGSGYMHVRACLEEHLPDAAQDRTYARLPANVTSEKFPPMNAKWGTYVPGIFGRHPLLGNELINLPHILGLAIFIDGERLDMTAPGVRLCRRELRLSDAILRRIVEVESRRGPVRLAYQTFISAARPHLCVQSVEIACDPRVHIRVEAAIDADVRTNGFDHFTSRVAGALSDSSKTMRVITDAGDTIDIATRIRMSNCLASQPDREELPLAADGPVRIEKRTALTTSRDTQKTDSEAVLRQAANINAAALLAEHAAVWRERWKSCDVEIDGDEDAQRAMRFALYHLLRSHPGDPRVAIDPKGYTGDAYWGRFFWDTEMFLLPFFLYTDPARARMLCDFRINTLGGAQANAIRYGYPGARYAWESDAAGLECCPNWQYADHEVHVTADVVYGMAHYAAAAGEPDYLSRDVAAVIVETARYWLARVDHRADARVDLLGVMGPDEFMPISDNNAYTNRLVRFSLELAARHGRRGGATTAECAAFAEIAAALPLPRHPDDASLVLQCDGFDRLAEPRFDELWKDRSHTFASQVSQERLYRSKCLKQADVLMLMALFPREFSDAEVRRAWDYYLPYTTHDSSLSPGVHALIACRLAHGSRGSAFDDIAIDYFRRSAFLDLDAASQAANEGVHIANCGMVWQIAVFGFAGVQTALQCDVLTMNPRLPKEWTRLRFPLQWKGTPVGIVITRDAVEVENRGNATVRVEVRGAQRSVAPGVVERWDRWYQKM